MDYSFIREHDPKRGFRTYIIRTSAGYIERRQVGEHIYLSQTAIPEDVWLMSMAIGTSDDERYINDYLRLEIASPWTNYVRKRVVRYLGKDASIKDVMDRETELSGRFRMSNRKVFSSYMGEVRNALIELRKKGRQKETVIGDDQNQQQEADTAPERAWQRRTDGRPESNGIDYKGKHAKRNG